MAHQKTVIVGLAADMATARWGPWDQPATVIPATYVDAIAKTSAIPVVLPVGPWDARKVVDRIDALILAGGWDVDPSMYGQIPHPSSGMTNPKRDDWENRLLEAALQRDLPVLAICRGMQMLNIHCGGTLYQHLPDVIGEESHLTTAGQFSTTEINLNIKSKLGQLLGVTAIGACHHHQGIDKVGSGLQIVGRAGDGTVEAVEAPTKTFVIGVQWHPEISLDNRLFEALVNAAY